ncbi:hypothetical protein ACEPPZ_06765 [Paracoccus yeei]|uniref:hypothetical protein n=1 Tax=Paracoccus yeei TaxID=147645 RepID=UPI0037D4629B
MAYPSPLRFRAFDSGIPAEELATITNDGNRTLVGFNGTFANFENNDPPHIIAIRDAFKVYVEKVNSNALQLNPRLVPEKNAADAKAVVAPAYQAGIDGTISADEELALRIAKFENLPPVSDPTTEAAHRDAWHALPDLAARLNALAHWPVPALASVMRAGREVLGLDDAQAEIAMQRIREFNLTNSDVARTNFRLKSSLENPAPRGLDVRAVKQFAADAQDQWKAKAEDISNARSTLKHVAVLVAVMCSLTPDQAFELLTK